MARAAQVVVIGAGHNGLTAAAYLAQAGVQVTVLEALDHVGGAAVSAEVFPGVAARLSRYSYLVSLMPGQIVRELALPLQLRSRSVASYTPVVRAGRSTGLLVESHPGAATQASFHEVTGSDGDFQAWRDFYERMGAAARVLAPTMLEPLMSADQVAQKVSAVAGEQTWRQIAQQPLGETLWESFTDDDVRGVVATDGLIGTFASVFDESLLANRCLLYHLIGDGTGEWKVPVGGMGAVSAALHDSALAAGAQIVTGAQVIAVQSDGVEASVTYRDRDGAERTLSTAWVLSNAAPHTLSQLLGNEPLRVPQGSQLKVNMVLERLPQLRSGIDPRIAFAGTFHINESLTGLEDSYAAACRGEFPARPPGEIYCHTITDPSILSPELQAKEWHTMTLFGLHTPADAFTQAESTQAHDQRRQQLLDSYLDGFDEYLCEPIRECLARDAVGQPCVEARTPADLEQSVGLPGGHIFHRDLRWPWALADSGLPDSQPGAWGVETNDANVLVCGAGARRGGGVSGIPGRAAAMKVLASMGR